MSIMQTEVFEAFRDLGVAEDKAMRAAAALSSSGDARLDSIDGNLLALHRQADGLDAKLTISLWAIGLILAALLASQALLWVSIGRIDAQWSQVGAQLSHIEELVRK